MTNILSIIHMYDSAKNLARLLATTKKCPPNLSRVAHKDLLESCRAGIGDSIDRS
jgi:hypothetical protein